MANARYIYNPQSDTAAFSGGAWRAALPIGNITNDDYWRVARSTDASVASTKFNVTLTESGLFNAIIIGQTNLSPNHAFRVRAYNNAAFNPDLGGAGLGLLHDSDWIQPFVGNGELDFGHPDWWSQTIPFDDQERRVNVIYLMPETVDSAWWSFEFDDEDNIAGYIDIGRLFMGETYMPEYNYIPEGNGLTFLDNSRRARRLDGGQEVDRRLNPRQISLKYRLLHSTEYDETARFIRVAGFDGEVFVIMNPDDLVNLQVKSFFGRLSQVDPITQNPVDLLSAGFTIEEKF